MKKRTLVALIAIMAMTLAACSSEGGSDTTEGEETPTTAAEETPTTGAEGPEGLFGLPLIDPIEVDPGVTLDIAGSSTVFPLSVAVQTLWEDEGGPAYEIASIGSGGGLERFCVEALSDIANASRPIDEEEIAACQGNDREPIEIRVGTDALSLVISPGNTFATELTLEEVAAAFSLAETGATWADVNPEFPAHPIALFSPGADSGTFDYFNEVVFPEEYDAEEPSPILSSIANIVGEDDNVTVQGVAEDGCTEGDVSTTCGIGYFGYAYYAENQDVLVAVAVDAGEGDGPVAPSAESVDANTYPISRPLFMYTSQSVIDAKPEVASWIVFYLNNVNDLIGEVGYFPAPEEAMQEAADHIIAAGASSPGSAHGPG